MMFSRTLALSLSSARALKVVAGGFSSAFLLALSLTACADGGTGAGSDAEAIARAEAAGDLNLCIGQDANTFHCIDDTRFQLCTGGDQFVVNSCPANLCATRTPANGNPCIGRDRAREIDGVEPPQPGQSTPPAPGGVDNGGNTGGDTGGDVDTGGDAGGGTGGDVDTGGDTGGDAGAGNGGGNQGNTDENGVCVGGPRFDPSGDKNVGNGVGRQFIGGQCLSAADCASGCCALPCGICSGPGAQFQAGKQGCGFGD